MDLIALIAGLVILNIGQVMIWRKLRQAKKALEDLKNIVTQERDEQ